MTSDSPAVPPPPLEAPSGRRSRLIRHRDRLAPAFAHRDFVRLWRANLGTMMAFWMQNVAQGWLVAILTESAFVLATLAMVRAIPMLVLSPFGGVLADRVSRTKLLITSQLLFTVAGLAIGVLVATGRIEVWHLAISSIMAGTSFAISVPSRNALVSDLVPRRHVSNAIALTSTTMNASRIVGPALAGALVGLIGIAGRTLCRRAATCGACSMSLRFAAATSIQGLAGHPSPRYATGSSSPSAPARWPHCFSWDSRRPSSACR